jgi:tetratricopeptide (TPR) repeat protein
LGILTGGDVETAIDHSLQAVAIASSGNLDEIRAYAEASLAQIYVIAGRLCEAIKVGERALATFEALGNLWGAFRTICQTQPAALALGEWQTGLDYCRRALEHGETLKDLRIKVVGLWRTGAVHVHRGDAERGVQYCNEALALGALPFDAAMAKAVRGYGKIKAGQLDPGIADLEEAVAWFANLRLRYTYARYAVWLAEGHLRRGDCTAARDLIEDVLRTSRNTGYLQLEGVASWLMGECLAPEAPTAAEPHVEKAIAILERIGARNDLARAMVTRAALRQAAGDPATARRLLDRAQAIFKALGTLDEPARVDAAYGALDRGARIRTIIDLG